MLRFNYCLLIKSINALFHFIIVFFSLSLFFFLSLYLFIYLYLSRIEFQLNSIYWEFSMKHENYISILMFENLQFFYNINYNFTFHFCFKNKRFDYSVKIINSNISLQVPENSDCVDYFMSNLSIIERLFYEISLFILYICWTCHF